MTPNQCLALSSDSQVSFLHSGFTDEFHSLVGITMALLPLSPSPVKERKRPGARK